LSGPRSETCSIMDLAEHLLDGSPAGAGLSPL
jgi:hypothetical protein